MQKQTAVFQMSALWVSLSDWQQGAKNLSALALTYIDGGGALNVFYYLVPYIDLGGWWVFWCLTLLLFLHVS